MSSNCPLPFLENDRKIAYLVQINRNDNSCLWMKTVHGLPLDKKIFMIQRVQSLLFLIAGIAFISLYSLPFASCSESYGDIYQNLTLDLNDNLGLLIMALLGGLLSLLAIFLFRNRKLQSALGYLVVVLGLGLAGFAYYLYSMSSPSGSEITTQLGFGLAMPMIGAMLAFVGNIFIKKDENLVKSMDRLR